MLNKFHFYNYENNQQNKSKQLQRNDRDDRKWRNSGQKIQRILDENEPLTDGAPTIYTPKQAGVRDDCNVRTDRCALAMNAMDRVNNYKLNEYLKKGEVEMPKSAEDQTEGGVTEQRVS